MTPYLWLAAFICLVVIAALYISEKEQMISHQQQIVLAALGKAEQGLTVDQLRERHLTPQTAGSLVRLGYATRSLFVTDKTEIGYKITDQGRHVLERQLAKVGGIQGGTEYEPHPYEVGIRRDELGRGQCAICGELAGRRHHRKLNDREVWS